MFYVDNSNNVFNSSMEISDVLENMMPLTAHSVLTHEEFVRTQPASPPQSTTFSKLPVPTKSISPEMPVPMECNSHPAVSPIRLPSPVGNTNETGAEKEGMQSVLSAASAFIQMSSASQDRPSIEQQDALRTILSAASAYTARFTGQNTRRLPGKKTIGNAGHLAQHIAGKNKITGSVKSEVDNLAEGSYGRKVLSKLSTELEVHCGGKFSCDAFDCKSSLHFQKVPQTNSLFQELAKKSGGWSKIVKFCMLVDGHGDKDCSGAPSKAMRSFSLVFNGAYTAGAQTVESPFTTIEELHSYDLESDSDGKLKDFINKMAVEGANKVSGSTKLEQKIKNIDKDLRKCVKDIKRYTQRDKIIEMWTKWKDSTERGTTEAPWEDTVFESTLNSDKSEADDIEEEWDDPTE